MKNSIIIILLLITSLNVVNAQINVDLKTTVPGQSIKNVLADYEKGLQEVLTLNPKVYQYNGKGGIKDTQTKQVGLLVEEYAKVAPESIKNYSYSKTGVAGKSSEQFSIEDDSQIIYMLINAVKEQQAVIEDFKNKFEKLSNEKQASDHVHYQNVNLNAEEEKALLAQNVPNPFLNNTKIEYYIPSKTKKASIAFTSINGKQMKRIKIEHTGFGALNVALDDLPAGVYTYTLFINGKVIDTKEMVQKY